jgi:hypothetical protein
MSLCSRCGAEFDPAAVLFPECPECIRKRMKCPGGIQPHHTHGGAAAAQRKRPPSYAAMDGTKVFDFMAYSPGSEPAGSGCYLARAPAHGSVIAICHKPLGQIPGSGIGPAGHFPAEFAVLVDIEGKNKAGTKFMFEEEAHLPHRFTSGEWVPLPMCTKCGKKQAYPGVGLCISCRDALGLL